MGKKFVDEKGDVSEVIIEDDNSYSVNMGNGRYKLAEEMRPKKIDKPKGVFTSNIGPGSHGFAGIATLAGIIALAGVVIGIIIMKV